MKRIAERITNKIAKTSISVVFGFAILVACTGVPTSNAVELPAELIAVLGFAVMTLVTGAFKWLGSLSGHDLSDSAKRVAAAISSALVLAANYALGFIPAAYDGLAAWIFSLLIVYLGGTGLYKSWKDSQQKSTHTVIDRP